MIHVEGLEKRYGEVTALAGVSFDVPAGQVVAFLGPNGAGKSTTMKILTGFLVPDAGSCAVAGRPVDPSDAAGRAAVGYLPEATPLYAGMRVDRYLGFVAELHGLGGAAKRDAVGRVIEACHLGAHAGRRIAWLSKGYRQRVGLAQALVGDPSVLILDEPTSGLDPREVVRMRELIRELGAEKTVLLSTHVLGEAEAVCDRALVIAAGRLVADGTPRELARHRAGRVALALRVPAYDTLGDPAFGPERLAEDLGGVPGVRACLEVESLPGGVFRLELEVVRAPGAHASGEPEGPLGRSAEPTLELLAATVHERGWELSELSWVGDDLEATFLELTDPERLARGDLPVVGDAPGDPGGEAAHPVAGPGERHVDAGPADDPEAKP